MLSMVFCTATVSGTISSSRIFTPGSLASAAAPCGVGLVVAVVGLGADIDEADGQRRCGVGDVAARPLAPHRENDGDRRDPGEATPNRAEENGANLVHAPLIGRRMFPIVSTSPIVRNFGRGRSPGSKRRAHRARERSRGGERLVRLHPRRERLQHRLLRLLEVVGGDAHHLERDVLGALRVRLQLFDLAPLLPGGDGVDGARPCIAPPVRDLALDRPPTAIVCWSMRSRIALCRSRSPAMSSACRSAMSFFSSSSLCLAASICCESFCFNSSAAPRMMPSSFQGGGPIGAAQEGEITEWFGRAGARLVPISHFR